MGSKREKDALFEAIALMGKAFASPRRLELLDLLAQAPRNVDELARASGQSTANTSQHLKALHAAGMVTRAREGTNVRYGKGESVRESDAMISKFPSTEEIHAVVAGGTAGRFSVAIPGWLRTKNGSRPLRARWGKINRLTCSELHVILRAGSGTNGVR